MIEKYLFNQMKGDYEMKRKLKTLGLVLLAFTLTTAVGVSVNTETASAAKKVNAKKLKLKKKKLSMKVGDKKTLKVTVKPKKATLKWKSNKKKIATVSKKGVVKAKKKGTATITVTSGKKKATCKITVKALYNVKAVEVVNSKVVRVTLNKAKKLGINDFALAKKSSADAKKMKTLTVASVNNSKNKVYDLILAKNYDAEYDDNEINDEDYVSVTIKKLNGLKTKETIYYASAVPKNSYLGGKTGSIIHENIYFSTTYKGYLSSVKVTGLPAGLKAEAHNQFVTIKGIPTAVSNGAQATITAKDELGKALTQKVLFYIGSDTQIVSYIPAEGRTILANNDSSEYFRVRSYGGSGSYQYSLVNNTNKFISIDEDADIRFASGIYNDAGVREFLPAGRYSVAYSVADSNNTNITTRGSLDVIAVNGVKLSGSVVASDNSPVGHAEVSMSFKDVNHTFYSNYLNDYTLSEEQTDSVTKQKRSKGSYELVVYPSQVYTLEADLDGAKSGVVNFNPGTANQVRNFILPIYKVVFASNVVDVKKLDFDIIGVDGEGSKYYSEDAAYLKKGSYIVNDTDYINVENGFTTTTTNYQISANFTLSGNMTVNLGVTKVDETVSSEINSTPLEIGSNSVARYSYYKFVPEEDGQYIFAADQKINVYVYDMNKVMLKSCIAEEKEGGYEAITNELKKGTEYVIGFSDSGSVQLSKYVPAPAE